MTETKGQEMADRAISVLQLFTLERPAWTVEQAAQALGVSASSAYRYVAVLLEAGLVTSASSGHYRLGPAIIQYDRQIRLTDPLLHAARPVMAGLRPLAPPGSVVLLCRLFRTSVLCVHQATDEPAPGLSYERGRPMPLFRGATSRIILAYLPPRDLRRLYDAHEADIAAIGLGDIWPDFRAKQAQTRRAGHVISHAEVDPGRAGIAVPILDEDRRILGSLSFVIPADPPAATAPLVLHLRQAVTSIMQNSHNVGN